MDTVEADAYEFMMELGLTMAILPCRICAEYIHKRQGVLVPEIFQIAAKTGETTTEIFVRFRNRYHKHHTNEHPANT